MNSVPGRAAPIVPARPKPSGAVQTGAVQPVPELCALTKEKGAVFHTDAVQAIAQKVKRGQLDKQWVPRGIELMLGIKKIFDPKSLLNPGKKFG